MESFFHYIRESVFNNLKQFCSEDAFVGSFCDVSETELSFIKSPS